MPELRRVHETIRNGSRSTYAPEPRVSMGECPAAPQEIRHPCAQRKEKAVRRFEKPPRNRIIRALCDLEGLRGNVGIGAMTADNARPGGSVRPRGPVRVVGLQAAVTAAVAALMLVGGVDEAKSALLGGFAVVLPNAYFAWAAMRPLRPRPTEQEAMLAAGGLIGRWVVKIALTVVLLVAAIVVADAGGLGFFVGLGAALLAPLASPLVGGD